MTQKASRLTAIFHVNLNHLYAPFILILLFTTESFQVQQKEPEEIAVHGSFTGKFFTINPSFNQHRSKCNKNAKSSQTSYNQCNLNLW